MTSETARLESMNSNACEALLEFAWAVERSRRGTFVGLRVRKRGRLGRDGVRGDDLVHDVLVSGFSYAALAQRSLDEVQRAFPVERVVAEAERRGLRDKSGRGVDEEAVWTALARLEWRWERAVRRGETRGRFAGWRPLEVDGVEVRGAQVWWPDGRRRRRKIEPGSIYLQGLFIGRRVLEPSGIGPIPVARSRADVLAERLLLERLPAGRFVRYALRPGDGELELRAGGRAVRAMSAQLVEVDGGAVGTVLDLLELPRSTPWVARGATGSWCDDWTIATGGGTS